MKKRKMILLLCMVVLLFISICVCAAVGLLEDSPTEPAVKSKNPMGLPQDLLDALTEHLQSIRANVHLGSEAFAYKLNNIKNGVQGLHVTLDSSNSYYVCAYYNPSHRKEDWAGNWPDKYEFWAYCCVAEYTWVRFDSEKDIMESYDNKQFIVAFQINPAHTCRDIMSETAEVPEFIHFQIYTPEFKDGVNKAQPIAFNVNISQGVMFTNTFVYLNWSQQSAIYYSADPRWHSSRVFYCVNLEDDYYAPIYLYGHWPSGHYDENNLHTEFEDYYDDVMQVMVADKYSISTDNGAVHYYGLIDIEEIPNLLKNQEGGN